MEGICRDLATVSLRNLLGGFEQSQGPFHSREPGFKPWSCRMKVKDPCGYKSCEPFMRVVKQQLFASVPQVSASACLL
jgi:hypothetical protein